MKRLCIVFLLLLTILYGCTAQAPAETPPPSYSPSVDDAIADQVMQENLEKFKKNPPEPHTSDMVDYIALRARNAAKKISENETHSALTYIAAKITMPGELYENRFAMESAMYYGFLLDYAYKNDSTNRIFSQIGWDTVKAIKYVYRDTETPEEATSPRQQAIDGLIELGYLPEDAKE